jgi:putative ABC transport system ATP-binding protein
MGRTEAAVETVDLQMTYHVSKVEVRALQGVSLDVRRGEFVAVCGPSGCGKSTLLHVIGGMLTPTGGRVFVDGHDLTGMTDAQRTDLRRRKIGIVFQRYNLLPALTVEENLEIAERIYAHGNSYCGGDPSRRRELLRLLGLQDTFGRRPGELSGGEQQRVAVARAVIKRPSILLADEPTGNLDSGSAEVVLTMMKELNEKLGQTVIMITHNPEAAGYSGRMVQMKDGKIEDNRSAHRRR